MEGDEGEVPPTRGQRVYLVREALGTRREPMPLEKFAELIRETTGVDYDTSILSRMETGKRKVSIEDIEAIAPVDPLKRGKAWLAGWDDERGEGNAAPDTAPATPAKAGPTPARTIERLPFHRDRQEPQKQPVKRRPGRRASAVG